MLKAFEKITVQNTAGLAESNQVIKMNIFFKNKTKSQTLQPHLIILTKKFILYYQNHTKTKIKRILKIDFYTKFQILKNNDFKYIGIRFQRQGSIPCQLISHQPHVLRQWQKELEKRMFKRGFHQEFKAIKKIGKGNFAAVYLSIRLLDNKKFAVKAFSKEQIYGQEKGRESLMNQIRLLRQLNHTNILKLISVYQSANSIYLVLQYIEGQCLNSLIDKQRFTYSQIKIIMKGIVSAAAEMAKKNIIHRDIKPDNIIFRSSEVDSEIVLLDFGLATFAEQKQYIYTRCGTPGFVSPEIVNLKNLNQKSKPISDIFSIGLIFHILLFGKSLFKSKTFNQILSQNRACNFTLLGTQYDNLPPNAYDLLKKMLEKNPNMRISAEESLKHTFFSNSQIEIQTKFESKINQMQQIKQSSKNRLQDSLGKFDMKYRRKNSKNAKQINSIQFKDIQKIDIFGSSPKKSRFQNYRKKSGHFQIKQAL